MNTLFGEKIVQSISYSQDEILRDILSLHLNADTFEMDPTYNRGSFYRTGIPKPALKFDLEPMSDDVIQANVEALPLKSGSIRSIIFDPPFCAGTWEESYPYEMIDRYSGYPNIAELWQMYTGAILELARVLQKGGYLVVKCQDTVSGRRNHFSHIHIHNEAIKNGLVPVDLFILLSRNRLNRFRENQFHSRKFHSYFWVFRKPMRNTKPDANES